MTFDVFEQFATDEALESNGTIFKLGAEAEVLVARSGNRKFSKLITSQVALNKQTLDAEDDNVDSVSDTILIDVMAKTILLGWKGLFFKGQEIPYTFDNAKKLLGIKDFRRQISKFADDMSAYKFKTDAAQGEA